LAALQLQTLQIWLNLNLPSGHQFPQSSAHTTIMLHIRPCRHTHIVYTYRKSVYPW